MNTPSSLRCKISSLGFAALIGLLAGNPVTAAGNPSTLETSGPTPGLARDIRPTPVPRFEEYQLTRLEPEALLSSKGLIQAELPWAVNMPDTWLALLVGSKAIAARALHAEKMRTQQVRNIQATIDCVMLTHPAQAKGYQAELHRAIANSR